MQRSPFTESLIASADPGEFFSRLGWGLQGKAFFVDSNSAAGVDAAGYGRSWAKPMLTIEYAINNARGAGVPVQAGDVIYVAAGHNEGAGDAQIFDLDIAGVSIIGLGKGARRPILDFDHANATIDVGANNCRIVGFQLRPSVTGVLIGLDIETGVTGTVLEDIDFINGEDGAGVDEFVKALHLTSGNHDTEMRRIRIRAHASAAHATHGIHVDAASDRCIYEDVKIDGPYATNGILEDAASADTVVKGCTIDVTGTNYGFVTTSTFAEFDSNRGAGGRLVNKFGQEWYDGLGYRVVKAHNVATDNEDLFTVTGRVLLAWIFGEVTTVIGGAETILLRIKTTNTNICAATTIDTAAVDTLICVIGDAGDAASVAVKNSDVNGKGPAMRLIGSKADSCTIETDQGAADTGGIEVVAFWQPVDADSAMVAA